ncbi:hypothetical protein [Snuella lapsa]|uniref:Lipocalin-like domain-containing protein n=1 Tax=Snuella lapsa TaxID=870481 RepID=A0ABP6WS72_9FLAO
MKTIQTLALLFVLSITSIQNLTAQTVEAQLTGNWKLDYTATYNHTSTAMRAKLDALPLETRSNITSAYRNRTMTFKTDNSFVMTLADGRKVTGSWALDQANSLLEVTTPNGKVFNYKINSLDSALLVIVLEAQKSANALFPEMHFTKIQN